MSAAGVWAGLSDSAFLAGTNGRERDPARLAGAVLGGALVGLVAALCGMLLVLVSYAIATGQGARGLEGLVEAARVVADPQNLTAGAQELRLTLATAVDGVFMVVFVAFAAVIVGQPLIVHVTAASQVRWRLLAMSMALSAAMMAPVVIAERLFGGERAILPLMAISPLPAARVVYSLSALLLIPAAAAEELFFRGWLLRRLGVVLRRPLPLISITALAFAAMHFDFAPDAFLTRALMGAGFAYMTLRLGGIEFSTGAHAVNNMLIVLFLQPLSLQAPSAAAISGFSLLEDLFLVGGYVLLAEMVARSASLRRWSGVQPREISPVRAVSAHFG